MYLPVFISTKDHTQHYCSTEDQNDQQRSWLVRRMVVACLSRAFCDLCSLAKSFAKCARSVENEPLIRKQRPFIILHEQASEAEARQEACKRSCSPLIQARDNLPLTYKLPLLLIGLQMLQVGIGWRALDSLPCRESSKVFAYPITAYCPQVWLHALVSKSYAPSSWVHERILQDHL